MNDALPIASFEALPPYRAVNDFLGNDTIEALLAYASANEAKFKPSGIYRNNLRVVDPEVRVSKITCDFGPLLPELEARFREVRTQAISDLELSPFELSKCELSMAAHNDGAFFKRHIDTLTDMPREKSQRVLTAVLYFHSLPKNYTGGQLRLYSFSADKTKQRFIDIEPERDQLVLFPSWAPHEVMPVSCPSGEFAHSRFAINCWYHRPKPTCPPPGKQKKRQQ